MKVTDLMIGDWIEDGYKKAQVTSITCDGIVETTAAISNIEVVDPIPLTEDILVKNGFELGEEIGEVGVHIYRHTVYKTGNFSLRVYNDNTFHFASIKLTYVHQLQHLLRLCGIEKEIEL